MLVHGLLKKDQSSK